MKHNAIVRIVMYSIAILALVSLLLNGLNFSPLTFQADGDYTEGSGSVDAAEVRNLKIDWVAGSVTIRSGDVDKITFSDVSETGTAYEMGYSLKNGTLKIHYSSNRVYIGIGTSMPKKELTVTVPRGWPCEELSLDGASLEILIEDITLRTLDIDGAANELTFCGSLDELNCDGAACELDIVCTNSPKEIDLDGASIRLDLTLPEDCGYRAEMEGLSYSFRSDYDYKSAGSQYTFGNEGCRISSDGISCEINIRKP